MLFIRLLLFAFTLLLCHRGPASGNMHPGARSAGMAHASATLFDFWAVGNNQAGIAKWEHPAAAIYAENRFMLKEMAFAAAAIVLPTSRGVFGLSTCFFGNQLYGEGTAGLAYARMFGEKLSTGLRLTYLYMTFPSGFKHKGTLAAELGIIYELLPGLSIGVHVFNPGRTMITRHQHLNINERLTTVFRTGLSYTFSEKLLLSIEAKKDIRHAPAARFGAEYMITENVYVRAGLSTNPMQNTFGFGLQTRRLQINMASSYHYTLGYSPQAGLIYIIM